MSLIGTAKWARANYHVTACYLPGYRVTVCYQVVTANVGGDNNAVTGGAHPLTREALAALQRLVLSEDAAIDGCRAIDVCIYYSSTRMRQVFARPIIIKRLAALASDARGNLWVRASAAHVLACPAAAPPATPVAARLLAAPPGTVGALCAFVALAWRDGLGAAGADYLCFILQGAAGGAPYLEAPRAAALLRAEGGLVAALCDIAAAAPAEAGKAPPVALLLLSNLIEAAPAPPQAAAAAAACPGLLAAIGGALQHAVAAAAPAAAGPASSGAEAGAAPGREWQLGPLVLDSAQLMPPLTILRHLVAGPGAHSEVTRTPGVLDALSTLLRFGAPPFLHVPLVDVPLLSRGGRARFGDPHRWGPILVAMAASSGRVGEDAGPIATPAAAPAPALRVPAAEPAGAPASAAAAAAAAGTAQTLPHTCAVCGKADGVLHRCKGCLAVRYCCAEHQRAHWPAHKAACRAAQQAAAGPQGAAAAAAGSG
ncbi:MAG: hypothetical protein J3K34DRAFT_508711 [Monoraphidium minutum]|nr:MAG: hypothetical protein J3K34DRAFT_508711 [Monoraphidium minutum]